MITLNEVLETNEMISKMNLDVRTITMGISLLDCIGSDVQDTCNKIYEKITTRAKDLVKTGEAITEVYGIWGKTTYNGRTGWMSLEYSTYLGNNAPQKNVPAQSSATGNGDADGDGDITAGDARLILRHSVSLELINATNQNRADVNGDGRITPEDARIVLRKAVHIE